MSIRTTWNSIEAVLVELGFPLADADETPQGRRCTIRVVEIPGDQARRGAIGSGTVRLVWGIEIAIAYEVANNKRVERKIAEDAEDIISAVYADVSLRNHNYIGASIERDKVQGVVTNTMRWNFQDETAL